MAIGNLADLEEITPTSTRPAPVVLFNKAIESARQHYDNYLAWRNETGVVDQLGSMLSGPPSIRYYERVDA